MDKMKKALMIAAIFAILLIAGSVTYYYVFYLPGNARAKQQIETENKKALNDCLKQAELKHASAISKAWDNYKKSWDGECKSRNLPAGSPLPVNIADKLDQQYKDEIDRVDKLYENEKADCFKLYK
jgi:hypothetical protein